jgi:LmbE family N-acetylglucosaminyl deacetylase
LKNEAESAARILGASDIVFGGLPDNRFDSLPLLDIVKTVEGWIERYQPEIVYTHHPGDLNIDHGLSYRAVLTASRPTEGTAVREIYSFEIASSTEWAFQSIEPVFRPNTFVDIAATIDRKIEALQAYETEVRPFPHPRSPEALRAMALRWGSATGMEYAEAFEMVRSIRR